MTPRRALLALPVLLLVAAPLAAAEPPGPTSFTGSCVLTGVLSSPKGVGFTPGSTHWDIAVEGHCSGVLDGQRVTAHPASLTQTLDGDAEGCLPAGTARAAGRLDFGRGRSIGYTGQQAALPLLVMTGDVSGAAPSVQTAYTLSSGGSSECAAGTYRKGGFEVRLRAEVPLVG